jgi:hypothetical protein
MVWLVLPQPEWLTSPSVPQDPMVWLVLPQPEWLILYLLSVYNKINLH